MAVLITDVNESRGVQLGYDIQKNCKKLSNAFLELKEIIDAAIAKGFITFDTGGNPVISPPTDETLQKDPGVKVKSEEIQTFLLCALIFAGGISPDFKNIVDRVK